MRAVTTRENEALLVPVEGRDEVHARRASGPREIALSNCSVADAQVSMISGSSGLPWRKKSAAR